MNKTQYKQDLQRDIKKLRERADERRRYLEANIDAANFDEVSSDYRAILVKIESKRQRLNNIYSSNYMP
jgi:hypothetical protein